MGSTARTVGPFCDYEIRIAGEHWAESPAPFCFPDAQKGAILRYHASMSDRRAPETISPIEKDHFLFKEFGSLDDAFGWARHINAGRPRHASRIDGRRRHIAEEA